MKYKKKINIIVASTILIVGLIVIAYLYENVKIHSQENNLIERDKNITEEEAKEKALKIAELSGIINPEIRKIEEWPISINIDIGKDGEHICTIGISKTGDFEYSTCSDTEFATNRTLNEEEMIEVGKKFIKKHNITIPKNAKFKGLVDTNQGPTLLWVTEINGIVYPYNEIRIIVSQNGVVSLFSKYWKDIEIAPQTPKITKEEAVNIAKNELEKHFGVDKNELNLKESRSIYNDEGALCYVLIFEDHYGLGFVKYYRATVNSQNGKIMSIGS